MEQQEQNQNEESIRQPAEEKKSFNISTPAAIVTAGVIIALALIFSGKGGVALKDKQITANQPTPEQVAPTGTVSLRDTDYVRGDLSKAEVVIVEYSDSDCPFCQRFHVTMQETLKKYGTKVAWVYRHFPLDIHPNANNEAYGAECAGKLGGNDAFWNYLDQVIDITVSPDKSEPILTGIATSLGINANEFKSCIASNEVMASVQASSVEGQSLGARGTPYSIAIGKDGEQVVIPGALPTEEVSKIVDNLLK